MTISDLLLRPHLLVAFLSLPILFACSTRADPGPTQIVYRFDDHRYLTLTGHRCEGAVTYIDESRNIRTEVVSQYWRLFLGRYVHADGESGYIMVPYWDGSAFEVSRDFGKTFKTAHWIGMHPYGFPGKNNVVSITIVDKQAFVETRDHRLAMTSKPIGKHWGMEVIDTVNVLPNKVHRDYPEFQNLPTEIPEVKNYEGWTEMHCNPDL